MTITLAFRIAVLPGFQMCLIGVSPVMLTTCFCGGRGIEYRFGLN